MDRVIFPLRCVSDTRSDGKDAAGNSLKRVPKFHHDRDAWGLGLITNLFRRPGDTVESLLNVPGSDLDEHAIRRLIRQGDLVLMSTRVASDDGKRKRKKSLVPGVNWLERQIIKQSRQFLRWCDRKHVLMTEEGAACLAPEYADRAFLDFQVNDDEALYEGNAGPDERFAFPAVPEDVLWWDTRTSRDKRRTAGFILHLQELWPDGPEAVILFGMSGPITFGFANAVAEVWTQQFPSGFEFSVSELIFVEITSDPALGPDILVPPVQGHPTYWRHWRLAWNRQGTLMSWPSAASRGTIQSRPPSTPAATT